MLAVMSDEVTFSPDLYRGTAEYYDRFRLSYPDTLISDLVHRTRPSGQGRLLDLACGTGQLAFALRSSFAEVWAVDQEPDMVEVVRSKAASTASGILPIVASAEELDAPPAHFSLIAIGNAFHRLHRDLVAGRVHRWLEPGGFLALCWSSGTQAGSLEWQVALAGLLGRWKEALGGGDRVPANWDQARRRRPDADVLAGAGLEPVGRFGFTAEQRWTLPKLAGFARSLSVLPAAALAEHAAAFDDSLSAELGPYARDGYLTETVSFAYELAVKGPSMAASALPPTAMRTLASGGMPIVPDDKDWTWVLGRPCPECGLDTQSFSREEIPAMIRANAAAWRAPLAAPDAADRPQPDQWSALEYGCHVRDVFRLYDYRLGLMLTEDDLFYPNWNQDETAVADDYASQDPAVVAGELASAGDALAASFAAVSGDQWLRPGRRSDGASFTVETFARYFMHDPIHHLHDVTGIRPAG
jgi:SAM-dependent methyltransferase